MAHQIYVGNLNYKMSEDSLKDIFTQYGEVVSAKIITDRDTGRSKGFGFVEMSAEDNAIRAIEELNGKNIDGRNLVVNKARERRDGRWQ